MKNINRCLITILVLSFSFFWRSLAQENWFTVITAQQNANIRAEPNSASERVAILNVGESATMIGENPQGEMVDGISLWYRIQVADDTEGWVWSGVVEVSRSFSGSTTFTVSHEQLRANFSDVIIAPRQLIRENDPPATIQVDWDRLTLLRDVDGNPLPLGTYLEFPPIDSTANLYPTYNMAYFAGVVVDIYINGTLTGDENIYHLTVAIPNPSTESWILMTTSIDYRAARITTISERGEHIGYATASGDVLALSTVVDREIVSAEMVYYTATNTFSIPTAEGISTLAVGDPIITSAYLDSSDDIDYRFSGERTPYEWLVDITDTDSQNDGTIIFGIEVLAAFISPEARSTFPPVENVMVDREIPILESDLHGYALVTLETLRESYAERVTSAPFFGGPPDILDIDWGNLSRLRNSEGDALRFGIYDGPIPVDSAANPWAASNNANYMVGVVTAIYENPYSRNYVLSLAVPIAMTREWATVYVWVDQFGDDTITVAIAALDEHGQFVGQAGSETFETGLPVITGETADLSSEQQIVYDAEQEVLDYPTALGRSMLRVGDPVVAVFFPNNPDNFERDRELSDQIAELTASTASNGEQIFFATRLLITAADTVTPIPSATSISPPSLTVTATLSPALDAYLYDDFSTGNLDRWDVSYATDHVVVAEVNGNPALHLLGNQTDYLSLGFRDTLTDASVLQARVQVIRFGSGNGSFNFNLMSALPGHSTGYSALIGRDGAFLAERDNGFRALDSFVSQPLTLQTGRWYTIRFEQRASTLSLTVDDKVIHKARVSNDLNGQPLFIFDAGMEVYLDDVQIEYSNR